jgi:hypothetical protein
MISPPVNTITPPPEVTWYLGRHAEIAPSGVWITYPVPGVKLVIAASVTFWRADSRPR